MNTEYFEKEITLNGSIYGFWQLEVVSSNVDLNTGILGCMGYRTLDDLKSRQSGVRSVIAIRDLTASASYTAVRQEALSLVAKDPRFIGAQLKQYEVIP